MQINMGDDEQPEIGLIALIDCIFFLLMFFMVATSFKQQTEMQQQYALPLTLPEASASLSASASAPKSVAIAMDKKGNIFLDGEPVSINELQDSLKKMGSEGRQTLIDISGDESVAYKNIISIIDICQFEGFTNIALHIRSK